MTELERVKIQGHSILVFDGVCVFCHRTVRFLLARDPAARLLFLPMESSVGKELLAHAGITTPLEGVALITAALTPTQRITFKTEAFADALGLLGGPWALAGRIVRTVPAPLREAGYRLIARNRYRIFGKYETCPLPSPAERERYLGTSG